MELTTSRNQIETFLKIPSKTHFGPILNSLLHALITLIILAIYGGKACPFVTGITFYPALAGLSAAIFPPLLIRSLIARLKFDRLLRTSNTNYFLFEFSLYFVWAILANIWGIVYYDFHLEGILKISLGILVIGLFFSVDQLNARERYLVHLARKQKQFHLSDLRFFSLRKKILLVGSVSIGLVGIAISLVTYKNFIWTAENVAILPQSEVILSVMKETLFVIGIFLGLVIKLTVSYSRNLKLYFFLMTYSLDKLVEEQYEEKIPIVSHDEFALLSNHLNNISTELKEKRRIKGIFGKIVSPVVAKRLLSSDDTELGGFEEELVILFSDIRNFTSMSEFSDPKSIILRLNTYLTHMVEIIHSFNGIVDKFMGDGIMAVFGLGEDKELAVVHAVQAGIMMQKKVREGIAGKDLKIGVGIHKGIAVAGLIGSPERMEFTLIGDTVNTASRLEAATKQVQMNLLISKPAFEALSNLYANKNLPEVAETIHMKGWKSVGELSLKGKQEKIEAYAYTESM